MKSENLGDNKDSKQEKNIIHENSGSVSENSTKNNNNNLQAEKMMEKSVRPGNITKEQIKEKNKTENDFKNLIEKRLKKMKEKTTREEIKLAELDPKSAEKDLRKLPEPPHEKEKKKNKIEKKIDKIENKFNELTQKFENAESNLLQDISKTLNTQTKELNEINEKTHQKIEYVLNSNNDLELNQIHEEAYHHYVDELIKANFEIEKKNDENIDKSIDEKQKEIDKIDDKIKKAFDKAFPTPKGVKNTEKVKTIDEIKDKTKTKEIIKNRNETKENIKDRTEIRESVNDKNEIKESVNDRTKTKEKEVIDIQDKIYLSIPAINSETTYNINYNLDNILEKTKTRKKREITKIDPTLEIGFGIKKLLETMSSQEENENYIPEFTREKLREMFKTGNKLPTSFSEEKLISVMENTFSKPFNNLIGDVKTKSMLSTIKIFQTLLQDKFNSQIYIKVKFSDKLKHIASNTHELYSKLGLREKIPDDMPLNCIESKRLIDPRFILFFLKNGLSSKSSHPSIYIETNLDWLNIGYKVSDLDPIIDYELQSDLITDYFISIIQSFVLIQKLVGSNKKPLQTLRTWGKIRIGAWGEKFNLKQKIDVLIESILKVEQFLGINVGDFLFEKVMNFPLLNKRGMDLELINWLKKNWRNIPYTNSYEETQFFYKWKEIESTYPNNLINNPNTKFEVTRFAQSIIEMGNLLHINRFFPHNPIKEPIGTDANVMNNIVSKLLSDFIPSEFTSLFSQILMFSTANLHDIRHRIDTKPTSIQVYKLFIYEYLKQLTTNIIYQGNTSEFTEINRDLWNAQQSGLVESPIFSKKYLSKYNFSGNLWLKEYFAHSRSKIHLYKKSKSLMSFSFGAIDENGIKGSFTTKGHPAESHLFRITTKYKDQSGNLIETIQNMLYDIWYYTSLNYQNEACMRFVRDAADIIISHKNERTDIKKDVYLDGILFLGFLFGLDALLPISQERAGIKKFDYFMSKMFDSLGVRDKYHPFSETLVINKDIAPNQRKKFEPGTLTPYTTTTGKLVQLELFKLLPLKHFNDNGTWTIGYYDGGIPLGTSYRDLYRDAMMCGNAHIFDRLPAAILKQISDKGITATEGNFGVIFDYDVAHYYYQARLIAGKRYAEGIIPQYKGLKEFVYSLKNLNFDGSYEERLGLPSAEMAQKIFTAFGLNWNCLNINDEDSLYLCPEAKKLWDDIKFQNTYKYGGHDNLWAKVAFFGIFQRIYQSSKQIHLLFNPNEFFSDKNNLWHNKEGIYDKNLMENELSRYLESKLARWEKVKGTNRLFWNYPADPSKHFGNYKYFSILYLNDFLTGKIRNTEPTINVNKPNSINDENSKDKEQKLKNSSYSEIRSKMSKGYQDGRISSEIGRKINQKNPRHNSMPIFVKGSPRNLIKTAFNLPKSKNWHHTIDYQIRKRLISNYQKIKNPFKANLILSNKSYHRKISVSSKTGMIGISKPSKISPEFPISVLKNSRTTSAEIYKIFSSESQSQESLMHNTIPYKYLMDLKVQTKILSGNLKLAMEPNFQFHSDKNIHNLLKSNWFQRLSTLLRITIQSINRMKVTLSFGGYGKQQYSIWNAMDWLLEIIDEKGKLNEKHIYKTENDGGVTVYEYYKVLHNIASTISKEYSPVHAILIIKCLLPKHLDKSLSGIKIKGKYTLRQVLKDILSNWNKTLDADSFKAKYGQASELWNIFTTRSDLDTAIYFVSILQIIAYISRCSSSDTNPKLKKSSKMFGFNSVLYPMLNKLLELYSPGTNYDFLDKQTPLNEIIQSKDSQVPFNLVALADNLLKILSTPWNLIPNPKSGSDQHALLNKLTKYIHNRGESVYNPIAMNNVDNIWKSSDRPSLFLNEINQAKPYFGKFGENNLVKIRTPGNFYWLNQYISDFEHDFITARCIIVKDDMNADFQLKPGYKFIAGGETLEQGKLPKNLEVSRLSNGKLKKSFLDNAIGFKNNFVITGELFGYKKISYRNDKNFGALSWIENGYFPVYTPYTDLTRPSKAMRIKELVMKTDVKNPEKTKYIGKISPFTDNLTQTNSLLDLYAHILANIDKNLRFDDFLTQLRIPENIAKWQIASVLNKNHKDTISWINRIHWNFGIRVNPANNFEFYYIINTPPANPYNLKLDPNYQKMTDPFSPEYDPKMVSEYIHKFKYSPALKISNSTYNNQRTLSYYYKWFNNLQKFIDISENLNKFVKNPLNKPNLFTQLVDYIISQKFAGLNHKHNLR